MTIESNEFAQSPDAQKVLDRISADTGTGTPQVEQGTSLVNSLVHPLADGELLDSPCQNLLKCSGELVSSAAAAAAESSACGRLLKSTGVVLLCKAIGATVGGAIVGGFAGAATIETGPGALLAGAAGVAAGRLLGGAAVGQLCSILTNNTKDSVDCTSKTYDAVRAQAANDECTKLASAQGCGPTN
jgi:outer membrane lipoprotein SlyB